MPLQSLHLCSGATTIHRHDHLGFHRSLASKAAQNLFPSLSFVSTFPKSSPSKLVSQYQKKHNNSKDGTLKVKGRKDNVWSIDNELSAKEKGRRTRRGIKRRGVARRKRNKGGRSVMVSGAMLMEVETVLQTQVFSGSLLLLWVFLLFCVNGC